MTRTRPPPRKRGGRSTSCRAAPCACACYAGEDPLSGKRHYLVEVIPAGPKAAALAEAARTRLLAQVDERRNPRTNATLDQLLDRYLETLDVGRTTHRMYTKYLQKHVRPFVGRLKAGAVDVEALDSLYAELRRCRIHCTDGAASTTAPRASTSATSAAARTAATRCRRRRSATSTSCFAAPTRRGVRWRWVSTNPVPLVDLPEPAPDHRSADADEAAADEGRWHDPDWGRSANHDDAPRGELCGLRWSHVDLRNGVVTIRQVLRDVLDWRRSTKSTSSGVG